MVGHLHFPFCQIMSPFSTSFGLYISQNSTLNILTSTGNLSAGSFPGSLQVVNLIPVICFCFCRSPFKKQKNNKTFPLHFGCETICSHLPPGLPSVLTQQEAATDHCCINSKLICLMEIHGPYFSREQRKTIGLLPSEALSIQATTSI